MSRVQGANANYYGQEQYVPPPALSGGLIDWAQTEPARRKPTQPERRLIFIDQSGTRIREAQEILDRDIDTLRRAYAFTLDEEITAFLKNHQVVRTTLREAVQPLKDSFGQDKIFRLEVSTDEDQSRTLFAIALWHEEAEEAARAFDLFVENWWLHRMNATNSDLAFAYKLL